MTPTAPELGKRASTTRVLLVLGGAALLLTVVFGAMLMRHRASYRAYVDRTLAPSQHPPRGVSVPDCVAYAVDWAMHCPGIESWCANEAPQVARACFAATDLAAYCKTQSDAFATTSFGVEACTEARASLDGTYARRSHKKFCASVYRSLAERCQAQP